MTLGVFSFLCVVSCGRLDILDPFQNNDDSRIPKVKMIDVCRGKIIF